MSRGSITLIVCLAASMAVACSDERRGRTAADKTTLPETLAFRIEPLSGAPWRSAAQLGKMLTDAAETQLLPIKNGQTEPVDYTISGAATAGTGPDGTLVIVALDVLDASGARVHRIVKEATLTAPPTSIGEPALQQLANAAAEELAVWYRDRRVLKLAENRDQNLTTASIGAQRPAAIPVYLVAIRAAPGDGNDALAAALRAALERKNRQAGPAIPGPARNAAYIVTGLVATAPLPDGYTHVRIEWTIKTLDGQALGLITQRNDLPADAVNGHWAVFAQTAADAAADGVLKLIAPPAAQGTTKNS